MPEEEAKINHGYGTHITGRDFSALGPPRDAFEVTFKHFTSNLKFTNAFLTLCVDKRIIFICFTEEQQWKNKAWTRHGVGIFRI